MNDPFSQDANILIPAVVQHAHTKTVLMLGYMNRQALEKTLQLQKVTFYSRSKQRLWTKGESSGNFLHFVSYAVDCDADTILVQAVPEGPTCHTGTNTCFGEASAKGFLYSLEQVVSERKENAANEKSYTASLFNAGVNKIAQKVGEEATEVVIEAVNGTRTGLLNESADLLFHFLVLLRSQGMSLTEVEECLQQRHQKKNNEK